MDPRFLKGPRSSIDSRSPLDLSFLSVEGFLIYFEQSNLDQAMILTG
jgi:hypothetical protein